MILVAYLQQPCISPRVTSFGIPEGGLPVNVGSIAEGNFWVSELQRLPNQLTNV